MAATGWVEIGSLDDIPLRGARRVMRPQGMPPVAVFRTGDDEIFALIDRCPHRGGPLSEGIVFGEQVACPLHNWTIDLASGRAAAPDEGATACYPVRVESGSVLLELPEAALAETALLVITAS